MRYLIPILCSLSFIAGCGDDARSGPIDSPTDTGVDPCLTCAAGQICVQRYDGVCNQTFSGCVTKTAECSLVGSCSADCEAAYCPSPYQCHTAPPCPGESSHALICRGP